MHFGTHRPVFGQLVDMLSLEILDGTLKPGEALPEVEKIALSTSTNPKMVDKALEEMSQAGAIEDDGEGGFVVSVDAVAIVRDRAQKRFIDDEMPVLARRLELLGIKPEDLDWKAADKRDADG